MLNVGPLELLVVVAVALIVVGPERLPELARSVGRMMRQLRQVQDEVRDMVATGVDEDVRRAASDLKRATSDLTKAADVRGTAREASRAARGEVRETLRPADGPAEPDAPTAPDGSALPPDDRAGSAASDAEGAGAPADRLVEDPATNGSPGDAEERS